MFHLIYKQTHPLKYVYESEEIQLQSKHYISIQYVFVHIYAKRN